MSIYAAELQGSIVARVIVAPSLAWCEQHLGGVWVETADPYAAPGAVAYCGPGWGYDPTWPLRFAGAWRQPGHAEDSYPVGAVVYHAGHLWASTTPANVWEPGVSGWRRTPTVPGQPVPWVTPTGAHDAYAIDEHVSHAGLVWRSTVAANVWAPGVHGWVVVAWPPATPGDPPPPDLPPVWQPWDGIRPLYQVGDRVRHPGEGGQIWVATVGNNHWEPGVFGWVLA